MYPVEYEVHVWDDYEKKETVLHGVVFANSFTTAMTHLEKYYGVDIISIKMYMLEETSVPLYEFECNCKSDDCHGMFKLRSIETYDGY